MDTERMLAQWRAYQNAQGLSERTIDERANVVRHLGEFSGVDVLAVEPGHIVRFLGRRALSATSKATYFASIRAFTKWAGRVGLMDADPTVTVAAPRRPRGVPRPLADHHFLALLAVANRRRTRGMILLGALAGLRVHEIAKVRGSDFDLVAGTLTVTGKGDKTAILPLHEALAAEACHFPTSGWWFPSWQNTGEPILAGSVSNVVGAAMRRAGVPGSAHQLRHWYGSSLLAGGNDIRVVQELMRHDSIQSTQIYTRVDDSQRRAAVDTLELPTAA